MKTSAGLYWILNLNLLPQKYSLKSVYPKQERSVPHFISNSF